MNHDILKRVIFDQREIIRNAQIIERDYQFESQANYIVVGMRRAGKSTLLYKRAQDIVLAGQSWDQIIYLNFEDERLAEFGLSDFNDIVETAAELTDASPYYFLDEVQNIEGWERFARRMADAHQRVFVTGSNATMLSSEMESRLGGRYLVKEIATYDFEEYLDASGVRHDEEALLTTTLSGRIRAAASSYLHEGGFPESIGYADKRSYAESVYQKVLLGDIASRYAIRNVLALRILMKKVAETVGSEISFSKLHNAVLSTGAKISKDSVITYLSYAENAYLLFKSKNYIAKFSERESTPRYYFGDNALLNLFLVDKDPKLLENLVAFDLRRRYGNQLYYFKSSSHGIDIDFYVPQEDMAIQVAYTLNSQDYERETSSLVKLSKDASLKQKHNLIITFADDEKTIQQDGVTISIVPLHRFLLR